jgi:hypothetical protein
MEAQERVEANKFEVGQEDSVGELLSSVDEGLEDLPDGYGESRIVLMARDPEWAYAYWELPNEHKEELRRQGGQQLALRIYDVTDINLSYQSPHSTQEYLSDEVAREWYLPIPVSDRHYIVEIGYRCADGRWLVLATSTPVHIPPVYPSDWIDDRFISISWDEELRGKTFLDMAPSSRRIAYKDNPDNIYDEMFGLANEHQRVAGSISDVGETAPGSGQMISEKAQSSYLFASGAGMAAVRTMSGINASGVSQTMSGVGVSASGMGLTASGMGLTASGMGLTASGMGLTASGMGLTASAMGLTASAMGIGMSGVGLTASGVGLTTSGIGLTASGMGLTASGVGLGMSGVGLGYEMSGIGLTTSGMGLTASGVGLGMSGVGMGYGMSGVGLTTSGMGLTSSGVGLTASGVGLGMSGVGLGYGMSGVGLTASGMGLTASGMGLGMSGVGMGYGMSGVGLTASGMGLTASGVGMSMSGVGMGYGMSGVGLTASGMGLTASGVGMSMSGVGMGYTMSGAGYTMSGMGMSGIGIAASMPPIRPRKFWLVADAELIVYGATEPDANVTIGGEPVKLNPDGTFRFRMSFPDGLIDYPIMAVAVDGEQTRSIHMKFDRQTPDRHTNTKEEAVLEWVS